MIQYSLSQSFRNISFFGLICVLFVSVFTSCTSTKQSTYFKTLDKDTTLNGFVTNNFESVIMVGDKLNIIVTSFSKEEDLLFNQAASPQTVLNNTNSIVQGFDVDKEGKVLLHRLGKVQAVGLTRKQLAQNIQKDLLPFMKDPIVNVAYINRKITILGAVSNPQVLTLADEQISLLDAIAISGDLTVTSKRNDILIVREKGDTKIVKHVNLEDHSIFKSPWYYLQPNDIVYVTEDRTKIERTERQNSLRTTVSLVVSAVSLLIIVLNRIF